ncbi:MAG: SDR family oxidoreductase [Anaerolineae bacterium]|nr:SDR family oxidoreductase [Anaerolineae bacterium]
MTQRFDGRTALITGGAGGIGAAVARRLASEGANVAIADLSLEAGERIAAEIAASGGRAAAHKLDVTSPDDVNAVVTAVEAQQGLITMAVTCAGIIRTFPLLELPFEAWNKSFAVNLTGTFLVFQAVARRMVTENQPGSLVGLSSISGRGGRPDSADYAASKAGVISLVRSAALAFAKNQINVNAVCPGIVETEMTRGLHEQRAKITGVTPEQSYARIVSTIPLGRAQTAEDVADVVAFLLSKDASYITGQAINADGGMEFD